MTDLIILILIIQPNSLIFLLCNFLRNILIQFILRGIEISMIEDLIYLVAVYQANWGVEI